MNKSIPNLIPGVPPCRSLLLWEDPSAPTDGWKIQENGLTGIENRFCSRIRGESNPCPWHSSEMGSSPSQESRRPMSKAFGVGYSRSSSKAFMESGNRKSGRKALAVALQGFTGILSQGAEKKRAHFLELLRSSVSKKILESGAHKMSPKWVKINVSSTNLPQPGERKVLWGLGMLRVFQFNPT